MDNKWFDEYGNFIGELPAECVRDCTRMGDVTSYIDQWIARLSFYAPRDLSLKYLRGCLADYEDEEIAAFTQQQVNRWIMFFATDAIRNDGDFYGLIP